MWNGTIHGVFLVLQVRVHSLLGRRGVPQSSRLQPGAGVSEQNVGRHVRKEGRCSHQPTAQTPGTSRQTYVTMYSFLYRAIRKGCLHEGVNRMRTWGFSVCADICNVALGPRHMICHRWPTMLVVILATDKEALQPTHTQSFWLLWVMWHVQCEIRICRKLRKNRNFFRSFFISRNGRPLCC